MVKPFSRIIYIIAANSHDTKRKRIWWGDKCRGFGNAIAGKACPFEQVPDIRGSVMTARGLGVTVKVNELEPEDLCPTLRMQRVFAKH